MKDRKAAKQIIKRAKKNPQLYTDSEVRYAKLFRRVTKKNAKGEANISDSQSGGDDGLRGKGIQPKEPRQSKRSWIAKVLYKARTLVRF
jgi:hypothetical protein